MRRGFFIGIPNLYPSDLRYFHTVTCLTVKFNISTNFRDEICGLRRIAARILFLSFELSFGGLPEEVLFLTIPLLLKVAIHLWIVDGGMSKIVESDRIEPQFLR